MHIGQKFGIYPFSPQLLNAPLPELEVVYYALRKREMIESVFTSLVSKKNKCLRHLDNVQLPKKMCPFGCKVDHCPYDWDADKCPHDLDSMDLSKISSYVIKCLYMDDDESDDKDRLSKKISPDIVKALMSQRRPGNVDVHKKTNG